MGSAFDAERPWWPAALVPELVLCSLAAPDLVCHHAHPECRLEAPHPISTCGRFDHSDTPAGEGAWMEGPGGERLVPTAAGPARVCYLQGHPRSCGATVIAFVANVAPAVAESVNGVGCTPVKKLRASLRALGVATGPLTRITRAVGPRAGDVVIVRWQAGGSHYVVSQRDGYYDPAVGVVVNEWANGRPTSFVPVLGGVRDPMAARPGAVRRVRRAVPGHHRGREPGDGRLAVPGVRPAGRAPGRDCAAARPQLAGGRSRRQRGGGGPGGCR